MPCGIVRCSFVLPRGKVYGWLYNSFVIFSVISIFCLLFAANTLNAADGQLKQLGYKDLTDAGDYYLLEDGKRVNLFRTRDEIAVRYEEVKTHDEAFQDIQNLQGVPTLQAITYATIGQQRVDILQAAKQNKTLDVDAIKASLSVHYVYHVLVDPISKRRMIPTDELLVRIADDVSLTEVEGDIIAAGLKVVEHIGTHRMKVYLLRLVNPKGSDPLETSRRLAASKKVLWAEPNFIREIQYGMTPNDPLYNKQQDKHNTGQNGGTSDADVDAPQAWDTTTGSSSVVIAIIDDGVDTSHADLSIYNNPGESGGGKETDGIDNDSNGKIDDYQGWDFYNNDNNPNPTGTDGHGTGCAGVAAATINNSRGVAGIAGGCKILPVKISENSVFTSNATIGNAISYAADFADVLSNSWGGGAPSSYINSAIDDAHNNGRNGKGCPVFFATGNNASWWNNGGSRMRLPLSGVSSGIYRFAFYYQQGSTGDTFNGTVQIDNVVLLDGDGYTHLSNALGTNGRQDFEGSSFPPSNWVSLFYRYYTSPSTWIDYYWFRNNGYPFTGTGGSWSASSPTDLPNGGYIRLYTPYLSISGDETLAFSYALNVTNDSGLWVELWKSNGSNPDTYIGDWGPYKGWATLTTSVGYPANYTNSIAVGASTDSDRRSDYSQYGTGLDFVAPSNGGWNDVPTLDPTGSVGWNTTDYKMDFGGTSSACPLAAGIAALMLSRNSNLTASDIRSGMRKTCDKIGGVTYSGGQPGAGGWNQYYGYGRVNAAGAVAGVGGLFVELESFTAVGYNEEIKLEWETISEISSAGFRILRSEVPNESYAKITDGIIPAQGNTFSGARYSYSDYDVANGTTYYYKLEEVVTDGDTNLYGPVKAAPGLVSIVRPAIGGSLPLGNPKFEFVVDGKIKRIGLRISTSKTLEGRGTIRLRVKRVARRRKKAAARNQVSVVLGRRARKRLMKLAAKSSGTLYCGVVGRVKGERRARLLSNVSEFTVTN